MDPHSTSKDPAPLELTADVKDFYGPAPVQRPVKPQKKKDKKPAVLETSKHGATGKEKLMDLRDESEDEYSDYDSEDYSSGDSQYEIEKREKDFDDDQSYDESQEDYFDYDEEEQDSFYGSEYATDEDDTYGSEYDYRKDSINYHPQDLDNLMYEHAINREFL